MYSRTDVTEFIAENDVKFIRLAFCDVFGKQKNISIQPCLLEEAFETGIPINSSLIAGFGDEASPDVYLVPDPSTMSVLPWRPSQGRVVRFFCHIRTTAGEPFALDSRHILREAVRALTAHNLTVSFGAECEFYLFKTDENGIPTDVPLDKGGYLDLAPADRGENVRREICLTLEEMSIVPESSHHENGPGQNEIDFRKSDPLTSADNVTTFKNVVQTVAQKNGLHARFDPKPIADGDGNGLHINVQLSTEDLSLCHSFMAGILRRVKEMTLFLNPDESSYRRLSDCFSARYITWGDTRSNMLRVTPSAGSGFLFEICSPDCLANPYIAYALVIYAGLDGIREKAELPEKCSSNLYRLPPAELKSFDSLPETLAEAAKLCLSGSFIGKHLPHELIDAYAGRAGLRV